jgi:aryl-alcohol dehydrogenase-like predicted oxidoreductase
VLAQGGDTVPIPGTRRSQRLDENAAAVDVPLTDDELAEIDAVVPRDMVTGSRYPEEAMALLDG